MAKHINDPFDYSDDAVKGMNLSINRRRWRSNPDLNSIRETLIRCRDEHDFNCGLLNCRFCRERAQFSFAENVSKGWRRSNSLHLWTLVPADGWVAYEEIGNFDLKAFVRRHREKLKRILPPGSQMVGSADFSLNIFKNRERWWQVHFHILAPAAVFKEAEALLRRRYLRCP